MEVSSMKASPYEKLCFAILGALPTNKRSCRSGITTFALAKRLGLEPMTLYRWPLVPGSKVRVIPPGSAKLIERLSNGAVTADEIREFAKQHRSGSAA